MIDIADKYREVFAAELDEIRLGDTITGYSIDGPAYVPSPQGITVGWMLMITLKHNVLLGQEDVAVTVPLLGILPNDSIIRQGAKYVLEEARRIRHEASTPPTPEQIQAQEQMIADLANAQPNGPKPPALGGSLIQGR